MKRKDLIRILMILFILINFLVPAILLLRWCSAFGPLCGIPLLQNILFGIQFFLVFPVTITYLIVSLNKIFPVRVKTALLFFIPYLVNLTIYLLKLGFSAGFLRVWALQSLPLFLGYILALIIGFILVSIGKIKESGWEGRAEIIGKISLILSLLLTFLASWVFMFFTGIRLLTGWNTGIHVSTAVILFLVSIFMVFMFHFKLLKVLYNEGKL